MPPERADDLEVLREDVEALLAAERARLFEPELFFDDFAPDFFAPDFDPRADERDDELLLFAALFFAPDFFAPLFAELFLAPERALFALDFRALLLRDLDVPSAILASFQAFACPCHACGQTFALHTCSAATCTARAQYAH